LEWLVCTTYEVISFQPEIRRAAICRVADPSTIGSSPMGQSSLGGLYRWCILGRTPARLGKMGGQGDDGQCQNVIVRRRLIADEAEAEAAEEWLNKQLFFSRSLSTKRPSDYNTSLFTCPY
jgi:hypothetical protein